MRWLMGGLLGLLLLLQYRILVCRGGLAEANRLASQLEAAEAENATLSDRNATLTRELMACKAEMKRSRRRAREPGLIKEGGVYYQFIEEPDSP
ncbi:MAG: hypothetical protein CM15mP84_02240 [Cellvibrionales bacterium]|nr:MAG: hypothetical protein CM15mP84_02240 [Cellvibrionales bacterium]